MAQVICNPPLPKCYLGACNACCGIDTLKESLLAVLDDNNIMIDYKQWISVDRSTLETTSKISDEFVEAFCDKLEVLIPHYFIATQQASFYSTCKATLKPGEVLVAADFSEDAAQGFHWNNAQATIHPFVIYYRHSGEECHLSYVVISDCLATS